MSFTVAIRSRRPNPEYAASLGMRQFAPGPLTRHTNPDGSVSFEREAIDVSTGPQPREIIEYEDVTVECGACGASFSWHELQSDEAYRGDYNDRICPRCGEWDCCEVDFEEP